MIKRQRILVVCPARGGSKGIPHKNLQPFLGVPLVARVGHLVAEIPGIDRAIVSTDSEEIASVAKESGFDVPFYRPEDLSGDRISDLEVLSHALIETERLDGVTYDIVVMLQPTSPLRQAEHVVGTINMLIDGDWDAVWTVSETDSKNHPLKQLTVKDGRLDYYDPAGKQIIARQQLVPVYHRNGVAYAIRRSCLLDQKSISGERTGAFVLEGDLISIDTYWDLELSELLHARQEKSC
ncbi:MAG: acylneuraminate cytidylyltransferase family protein [Desulfuromonadales bacterium]|jgi:CMP-N,N'-diacetyllegionaminic acid synthase|nr:acylneuraminate cytidylyltransferase family protein [Desulfuromonadales bacterium]MDH4024613.1 acylneuraminate cytidylyltransferase family protein [Desulfuromonadales bacterium]